MPIFVGCAPREHVSRSRGHDAWTLVSATCSLLRGVSSLRCITEMETPPRMHLILEAIFISFNIYMYLISNCFIQEALHNPNVQSQFYQNVTQWAVALPCCSNFVYIALSILVEHKQMKQHFTVIIAIVNILLYICMF